MTDRCASPQRDFDVLIAGDFTSADGHTASIAQEVELQARLGLSSGLIQIDDSRGATEPWSEGIRGLIIAGLADIVRPDQRVKARLLVLRNPSLFARAGWSLAARGDHTLLVADGVPRDWARRVSIARVRSIERRLAVELGESPPWAPIDPGVRASLTRVGGQGPVLADTDWGDIANADGWEEHHRRMARYLEVMPSPVSRGPRRKRRVLFMSSNGGGMGHLTRLLGIARRLPKDHEALFLTMSTGVEAIRKQGFWADYMPGPTSGELRNKEWGRYLKRRTEEALRCLAPDAFVFDGTFAYRGLIDALARFPGIHKTWSRRGMWKPASALRTQRALEQTRAFDLIIEPGELAGEVDVGVTREQQHLLRRLEPMLLLDDAEVLPRPEARRELGIPEDRVAVLLNLGAGNINNIDDLIAAVAEVLRERPDVHVVALQSLIAAVALPESERVSKLQTYPLARLLRAFDICVAAPGYNSFHELLSGGVPTVFIPNEQTVLDDHYARAAWAQDAGLARLSRADDPEGLRQALSLLLDDESRRGMRERLEALTPCRGAEQAAELIVDRARSVEPSPPDGWQRVFAPAYRRGAKLLGTLFGRLTPRALAGLAAAKGPVGGDRLMLVVDLPTPPEDPAVLVRQHTRGGQPPLVVARGSALKSFAQLGVATEMLLDNTLEAGPDALDQATYLDRKIQVLVAAYGIGDIVCLGDAALSRRLAELRVGAPERPCDRISASSPPR